MFMLLPQIYRALNGKPHNIKDTLSMIMDDKLKSKIMKLFQTNRIPYK